MKLQIIALRYLTIDGLQRVSTNWSERNASEVMRSSFTEMLKQEPWETAQDSSPSPEVGVYLLASADRQTQSSLQHNLGDAIPAIAQLEEIERVKVHCVKVASNPLEVRRVLIFECDLKQNGDTERDPEDKLRIAVYRDLAAIDTLLAASNDDLSKHGQNIWVLIGDPDQEPRVKDLRTKGFDEVPIAVSIRAETDACLEKYFSNDAQYVIYTRTEPIENLELSDLVFLLLVPGFAPELSRRLEELAKRREEWEREINDSVVKLAASTDAAESQIVVRDVVQKLLEYAIIQREVDRRLRFPVQTLREKVASASRAPQEQVHHEIASDMNSSLSGPETRIRSFTESWSEIFRGLRDIVSISTLAAQLQMSVLEKTTSDATKDILEESHRVSRDMRRILDGSNLLAIVVAMFVLFQAPFVASDKLKWDADITLGVAIGLALLGAVLAFLLPNVFAFMRSRFRNAQPGGEGA